MIKSTQEDNVPSTDHDEGDEIIVGTSVVFEAQRTESDIRMDQQMRRKRFNSSNTMLTVLMGILVVVVIALLIVVVDLKSNLPQGQKVGNELPSSNIKIKRNITRDQQANKVPIKKPTETIPPVTPTAPVQPTKPTEPTKPTQPTSQPQQPWKDKFKNQQQKFSFALKQFNPWDLSVDKKKELLKKYKSLPHKDPKSSRYMPIVQDYDKQIKPILQEFQKNMEVINYSTSPMTAEERKTYTEVFEEKMRKRLIQKRRERDQQKAFETNPSGNYNGRAKLNRAQWFNAFQYHTLVGVDLSKDQEARNIAAQQIKTFQDKYQIGKYQTQIAMCIVTPSYNNVDHDRYLWTLESIIQQNYTNYRMVIIDDASPDKTYEKVAQHLKWRNASDHQFIVVKSTNNHKPMGNIFYGSQKYCNLSEIQYVIDGDDQLVGRQVFKVVNAMYQKQKMITLYSTHIVAGGTMDNPFHYLGISHDYWPQDIQNNNFRKTSNRGYHHLRTMMSDTILLMKPESLKDWRDLFYWAIGDNACYFPAMEMSCKTVKYLNEIFYIYNYNTGQTEDAASWSKKDDYNKVFRHINDQKPYRCLALQFLEISMTNNP